MIKVKVENSFLVDRMIERVDIKIQDVFFREVSWLRDPESKAQETNAGVQILALLLTGRVTTMCLSLLSCTWRWK